MNDEDKRAIEGLFTRIADVERRSVPRDHEAEAYIRRLIAAQPAATYYMAQTIIVQEQALEAAQRRLEELEQGGAQQGSGGGFFDSLLGGQSRPRQARRMNAQPSGPWGSYSGTSGSGFLAGAAQTAMGVAGGVVLGSMLADWLTPDEAAAAGLDQNADFGAGQEVADAGGDFDLGGDFDAGDF